MFAPCVPTKLYSTLVLQWIHAKLCYFDSPEVHVAQYSAGKMDRKVTGTETGTREMHAIWDVKGDILYDTSFYNSTYEV